MVPWFAAAQEERFTRRKHDYGFPARAIEFCLRHGGTHAADLDYVIFYEKPFLKFERLLITQLRTFPRSWQTFGETMAAWFDQKLWIKQLLRDRLGVAESKILFTEHHLAHAASAFFCSPFEEAAILTVDGVGEWATATMGRGHADWGGGGGNRIELVSEIRFPHSLGLLYSAFTAWLGFEVNEGEYKVMGMAPYGEPRYQDRVYKLIEVAGDGSFSLNMDYFAYHYSPEHTFNGKFVELFGQPRDPDALFMMRLTHPHADAPRADIERNQYYADVAASIQRVTEDILLRMANHLHRETGLRKLCMAGGVALNSVANGRILRETAFEELYIQPAAGDAGGAVGAALYVWHVLLGKNRTYVMEDAYLGEAYGDAEIHRFLTELGVAFECFSEEDRLIERVVDRMRVGKVCGWFQGRFEWGPRALGNRSILADPRRAEMKDIVNSKIKFREPFRPFAPVILEERAAEYFGGFDSRNYPARFMLLVLPWIDGAGEAVPAVNHVGTGRLQTIRSEWNRRDYKLVQQFGEATGVPVVLNTSFNLRGEPIVASPLDALRTFRNSGIDLLVLGGFVVTK